jgi:hypothetical protein
LLTQASGRASKRRDRVFDLGLAIDDFHRRDVEAHAFDARVMLVAALPQTFTRAAQSRALGGVDAAEGCGPGALTAGTHFDDDDYGTLPGDDVDFEVTETQVRGHDRVATLLEPERDEALCLQTA